MTDAGFIAYQPARLPEAEMLQRGQEFFSLMERRRSVREFSSEPVPREMIELAIATASTAPSGAHRQPWRFVAVDAGETKRQIRLAAEEEERRFYQERAPAEWLEALAPLGTTWQKPFLEIAPWLVVVFAEMHRALPEGHVAQNYYVKESVGIACGLFIASLHHMGLATLPHTPSPMHFLSELLGRPGNEKPYVLFPVGFPAPQARVPALRRKPLSEVVLWNPAPKRAAER